MLDMHLAYWQEVNFISKFPNSFGFVRSTKFNNYQEISRKVKTKRRRRKKEEEKEGRRGEKSRR